MRPVTGGAADGRMRAEREYADEPPESTASASRGWLVSALFHLCLALLVFAGADAVRHVERDRLYTYEPSAGAARDARERLDALAAGLTAEADDKRAHWDNLVSQALMAGDIAAARGLMLSARAMLDAEGSAAIARAARDDDDDAELESAALSVLTPGARARYQAMVPLLARRSGADTQRAARPLAILGDGREFEAHAVAALAREDAPMLALTISGLGAALRTQMRPEALAGASLVRAGLNGGRLQPGFNADLETLARRALPRERFAQEAASGAARGERDTVALYDSAFRASVDPQALVALEDAFARIGALAGPVGAETALALIAHARALEDIARLNLLLVASPDRAAAMARFRAPDGAVPAAARGWLRWTQPLLISASIAAAAFATLAALSAWAFLSLVWRGLAAISLIEPRQRFRRGLVRSLE